MAKNPEESVISAWIGLHRAHRSLLDGVEEDMKKAGLPPLDWYDVLLELHRVKHTGLHQYELCEKALLAKHNLSRLIDRLEKNRYVKRQTCSEDGRSKIIKISEKGEKLLEKIWPVYSKSIEKNFGCKIDSQDVKNLDNILLKLLK